MTVPGFYAGYALMIILLIGIVAGSVVAAHRNRNMLRLWFQRWYWYLLFALLALGSLWSLLSDRAEALGWETFRIPSGAMAPTLLVGDNIQTDGWAFRSSLPERGDIVVFRYPKDGKTMYVKRIIGLPGETIEYSQKGLYVSGELLDEPYVSEQNNQRSLNSLFQVTVPEAHYFVLGDNRDSSRDSRHWGFVPKENIHAEVKFIFYSSGRVDGLRADRFGKRLQ